MEWNYLSIPKLQHCNRVRGSPEDRYTVYYIHGRLILLQAAETRPHDGVPRLVYCLATRSLSKCNAYHRWMQTNISHIRLVVIMAFCKYVIPQLNSIKEKTKQSTFFEKKGITSIYLKTLIEICWWQWFYESHFLTKFDLIHWPLGITDGIWTK